MCVPRFGVEKTLQRPAVAAWAQQGSVSSAIFCSQPAARHTARRAAKGTNKPEGRDLSRGIFDLAVVGARWPRGYFQVSPALFAKDLELLPFVKVDPNKFYGVWTCSEAVGRVAMGADKLHEVLAEGGPALSDHQCFFRGAQLYEGVAADVCHGGALIADHLE